MTLGPRSWRADSFLELDRGLILESRQRVTVSVSCDVDTGVTQQRIYFHTLDIAGGTHLQNDPVVSGSTYSLRLRPAPPEKGGS